MNRFFKALFIVCLFAFLNFFSIQNCYAIEEDSTLQARITSTSISDLSKINRSYLLGTNDTLSIYVFDCPEYTQEKIKVQPDGNIVVAPLGPFYIQGKTIGELHDILVEKYKYYLRDPQITIRLDQLKPFVAYVRGNVTTPGSFELNMDANIGTPFSTQELSVKQIERKSPLLSNVLIAAGGAKFDSDFEHIQIKNNKTNEEFEVNLLKILESGDMSQDLVLRDGDVVYVPKLKTPLAVSEENYKKYITSNFSPKFVPVKVFGYVNHPGIIKLENNASISLNSAIMGAGGYLEDAAYAPEKVYLSRPDASGKLVTKVVNPMASDISVMPNDIVYVPEKTRPLIGKSFEALYKIILPFNMFANTYNNAWLMFDPRRYQVKVGY